MNLKIFLLYQGGLKSSLADVISTVDQLDLGTATLIEVCWSQRGLMKNIPHLVTFFEYFGQPMNFSVNPCKFFFVVQGKLVRLRIMLGLVGKDNLWFKNILFEFQSFYIFNINWYANKKPSSINFFSSQSFWKCFYLLSHWNV